MSWLFFTVTSYLMLAVVNLGDKFVVDKLIKSAKAYAFAVGFLSAVVFVIAPWFLSWPGLFLFLVNIISGALFVFALWTMYEALKIGEASRVVVVIGSIIPVFTILFSILFFKENFSPNQWIGILFLIAGMILISFISSRRKKWVLFFRRLFSVFYGGYGKRWIFLAMVSALLYSLFFITTKYAYSNQEFMSSFIWIRGGSLLAVLLFLIEKKDRKDIIKSFREKPNKKVKIGKGFVVINQLLGSGAFLLQNYAVYLGPVAIINALQGVQYAFILILGIFFSAFFPRILKEDISRDVLIKKIAAILLVAIGLYFIAV
jgi:drug/metabolite transporter (DMT)-like permease